MMIMMMKNGHTREGKFCMPKMPPKRGQKWLRTKHENQQITSSDLMTGGDNGTQIILVI